ncbi:MAG: site-specific DNA-methyltransferase [Zoogloeaceae bacterium]|nr:site-specific DNA-methyltransferase [Zoogloeaceae bacterium]
MSAVIAPPHDCLTPPELLATLGEFDLDPCASEFRIDQCYFGDCRDFMRAMIAVGGRKVQTIVTSPPYWGLRDYGVPGQIGREETPHEYVATLVEVFRAARELLADDGTLWLNLGDSYATRKNGSKGNAANDLSHSEWRRAHGVRSGGLPDGLKHKDLAGIPWRVALALQEDGWYLRQDIIWHKPNPMPESVSDRCTKAHEYLFLLSKSSRYYFDAQAIREPAAGDEHHRTKTGLVDYAERARSRRNSFARVTKNSAGEHGQKPQFRPDREDVDYAGMRNKRSVWTVATEGYRGAHFAAFPSALIKPCILAGSRPGDIVFDPFLGSGTTAQVAQALGRHWVGCELNQDYSPLQDERTRQRGLMLAAEGVAG